MEGLYTGAVESSFKTTDEIRRDAFIRDTSQPPIFTNYQPERKTWKELNALLIQESDLYAETEEFKQDRVEVSLPDCPVSINPIGDIHAGSPHTDLRRLEKEIEAIVNNDFSYILLMGDEVDSFFWAETAINDTATVIPKQYYWYREMIKYVSENDKLLGAWIGNHNGWTRKMGISFSTMWSEVSNAPCFYGMGFMDIHVGKTRYKLVGSHQYQGGSMYNDNHPEERAVRFGGAWGADIVIGGHTHKKSITQKVFTGYEGANVSTLVNVGAYKSYDSYGSNLGMHRFESETMGGVSLLLDNKEKKVNYDWDILKGLETHNDRLNKQNGEHRRQQ